MTTIARTPALLREAIKFDGFMTLPSGVLVAALAGVLADPLGIPTGVLIGAGLFFIAWGAGVLFLGMRPTIDRRAAIAVGVVNVVCAVDGVAVAFVADLTTLGTIALLALSAAVAGIGGLQLFAARR
jgi:hypothetical protein